MVPGVQEEPRAAGGDETPAQAVPRLAGESVFSVRQHVGAEEKGAGGVGGLGPSLLAAYGRGKQMRDIGQQTLYKGLSTP